jgi:hypothetical protein
MPSKLSKIYILIFESNLVLVLIKGKNKRTQMEGHNNAGRYFSPITTKA